MVSLIFASQWAQKLRVLCKLRTVIIKDAILMSLMAPAFEEFLPRFQSLSADTAFSITLLNNPRDRLHIIGVDCLESFKHLIEILANIDGSFLYSFLLSFPLE